ncbi:MAG: M3 family metallopeptidase, partial [Marinirhabdus sp.]
MSNPLLQPFNTVPFSKIENKHFLPALHKLIAATKAEIDAIVKNPGAPTFKNTVEALENTGLQLNRVIAVFFNLNNAETSEELQKIAQQVSPLLTQFKNDLLLDQKLFKKVRAVYETRNSFNLNQEEQMLLEKQYRGFSRNGASLSEEKKETLRKLDADLSRLKLTFGENVLAETNAYSLHITNMDQLSGLPGGAKEAAAQAAKEKGKEGWLITLDHPSYVPFMKYAENRALRKKLFIAFGARGFNNNKNNNEENVLKIVTLRRQRAQLLSYKSHAHFVLEERMAKTPAKVGSFLKDLLERAKPAAQKEFDALAAFAKKRDGIAQLQKWDNAFYTEKLKQQRFSLDDEK